MFRKKRGNFRMSLHEISALEKAHEFSGTVYKSIRNTSGISAENRLVKELSAIVSEGIHHVQTNEAFESSFSHIHSYIYADEQAFESSFSHIHSYIYADEQGEVSARQPVSGVVVASPAHIDKLNEGNEALVEMKEEPDEIKSEPVDDFADIKQEHPIVDIFCPSSGTSRILDQMNLFSNQGMGRMKKTVSTPPIVIKNTAEIFKVRTPVEEDRTGAVRSGLNRPFIKQFAADSVANNHSNKELTPWYDRCYLCDQHTVNFLTTPFEPSRRAAFLKSIVITTARDYGRVEMLKSNKNIARFCRTHVDEKQLVTIPNKQLPQFMSLLNVVKCYLCYKNTVNFFTTPSKPAPRAAFLKSIIVLTERDYVRVEMLKSNGNIAKVCPSHVAERSVTILNKRMAQKCDLCDYPTYPCYSSPDNMNSALRFFENIIMLPEQLDNINQFITFANPDFRASICMKHIKPLTADPSNKVQLRLERNLTGMECTNGVMRDASSELVMVKSSNKRKANYQEKRYDLYEKRYDDRLQTVMTPALSADDDKSIKEEPIDEPGPSGRMALDQCAQHWLKFNNSIKSAAHFTTDVEGVVGKNMSRITLLMFDLGKSANENWSDTWKNLSGKKSIYQQKHDTINFCFEIQKAVKHLIDMYRDKIIKEKKDIEEKQMAALTRAKPKLREVEAEPLFMTVSQDEVKKELVDIKEEPFEIKQEPADDFTDTKQEEPIADIFDPSTGTSRPLEQTINIRDEKMKRIEETEVSRQAMMTESSRVNISDLDIDRNRINKRIGYRKCDLCGELAHPYRYSPMNRTKIRPFFDTLIELTPEQRERIAWFGPNKRAIICMRHFNKVNEKFNKDGMFDVHMSTIHLMRKRQMTKGVPRLLEMPELVTVKSNNKRKVTLQELSQDQMKKKLDSRMRDVINLIDSVPPHIDDPIEQDQIDEPGPSTHR